MPMKTAMKTILPHTPQSLAHCHRHFEDAQASEQWTQSPTFHVDPADMETYDREVREELEKTLAALHTTLTPTGVLYTWVRCSNHIEDIIVSHLVHIYGGFVAVGSLRGTFYGSAARTQIHYTPLLLPDALESIAPTAQSIDLHSVFSSSDKPIPRLEPFAPAVEQV